MLSSLEELQGNDEFKQMERLQEVSGVPIPKNLAGLQNKRERHTGVIPKDQMLDYVSRI